MGFCKRQSAVSHEFHFPSVPSLLCEGSEGMNSNLQRRAISVLVPQIQHVCAHPQPAACSG